MPKDIIDQRIKDTVKSICEKKTLPDNIEFLETDNIGEVIDKLCIMHIRLWMLEDLATPDLSDEEMGKLKRKIDDCFKTRRPKLVAAINKLIEKAVVEGKSLSEESVKIYK